MNTIKTQFTNKAQLLRDISAGQKVFIENFIKPELSRVTEVLNKYSYCFTVNKEGKESWIINGADQLKKIGFEFLPEREQVNLFWKADNKPYLSLYLTTQVLKEKKYPLTTKQVRKAEQNEKLSNHKFRNIHNSSTPNDFKGSNGRNKARIPIWYNKHNNRKYCYL